MSIFNILAQPSTPPRNFPSSPLTSKTSPVSPSHRRRFEFLDSDDLPKAAKPKKSAKLLYEDDSKVTKAAKPILEPQIFAAASSSMSSPPVAFEEFVLPPVRSLPPRRRLGESLPKIDMDFTSGQKYLTWQKRRYDLTSVSTKSMERQHQVWLGKTPDEPNEVVIKTYSHIININKRESLMKGDRLGFDIWRQFLKDHPCPEIQLPQIFSKLEDAVLVMEYIRVEPEKLAFWNEWENKNSLEGLSQDAMKILEIARDVIALMWKHKIDLGDFRAENAIWKEGKLYPIDWQYIPPSEKGDLVRHLKHYIKDWAKGNEAVFAFLAQPVPDLLSASSDSTL